MCKTCTLVLLLLAAVFGDELRAKTFQHYAITGSWGWAQTYCRNRNADLVTIAGEKENQEFVNGRGWIGLHRENSASEWKWSKRDEITNFTIWKSGDPTDGENCAFKHSGTDRWETDRCEAGHSFMCFEERLVLVKENKSWEQALQHCRALEAVDSSRPATDYQNHRFDLATLSTPDDHVYAQEKAQYATTNEVWTGLRYLAGEWVWVGGGEVEYVDIKNCPSQRVCGNLKRDGTKLFNIRACKYKRNFLCSRKP
ncbi:lymphocyte antigen 75-like [Plectropomus leopardus]|uniref:lymphocyte antigen 75-like n=1 Tax=Plectropomus leopardus TaxID=160734 RepID=UPI001C4B4CF5|nr:lymphocyte antigen 75-like [Plectropomus leopardus]